MKKGLIVVVLLVLAGVGYFYYSKMKAGSGEGAMMGSNEVKSGMMSLKDLIAAGVPQKCTFSSTNDSGTNQGTTYVSGGRVRGDFTNTFSGKTTMSHMISDGKTSYIWTDGESTGYKMTVPETSASPGTAPSSEEPAMSGEGDLNQAADYNCSAWIPDNSMFTPPADVTFSDFSQMMQPSGAPTAPAMKEGDTSSQCSYCDSLSGDQKTQCLSALNCQ